MNWDDLRWKRQIKIYFSSIPYMVQAQGSWVRVRARVKVASGFFFSLRVRERVNFFHEFFPCQIFELKFSAAERTEFWLTAKILGSAVVKMSFGTHFVFRKTWPKILCCECERECKWIFIEILPFTNPVQALLHGKSDVFLSLYPMPSTPSHPIPSVNDKILERGQKTIAKLEKFHVAQIKFWVGSKSMFVILKKTKNLELLEKSEAIEKPTRRITQSNFFRTYFNF